MRVRGKVSSIKTNRNVIWELLSDFQISLIRALSFFPFHLHPLLTKSRNIQNLFMPITPFALEYSADLNSPSLAGSLSL